MKLKIHVILSLLIIILLFISSCASRTSSVRATIPKKKYLGLMGYTIQAGAFANVSNAARLRKNLIASGLDATYFKASDGLYKVRFGNYRTKELARKKAQSLKDKGIIDEFYIVLPENYAVTRQKQLGTDYLRESLVNTANDFIGVPYLWGGTSLERGFDCSGLTMTIYQLNGLDLPRNSAMQYEAGDPVEHISDIKKGDLVFFTFKKSKKISHVGIYIGDGAFIHASSEGQVIRIDSLDTTYFSKGYVGARTYF